MTLRTLIKRSLRFHWRSHLGVVIGAAIGSAALIGALIVGDSVKGSLRERALERLGKANYALQAGDRLVREKLADPLNRLEGAPVILDPSGNPNNGSRENLSGALVLPGVAAVPDGSVRANNIQVLGVSPRQWPGIARWGSLPEVISRWQGEVLESLDYLSPHQVELFVGSNRPGARWLEQKDVPGVNLKWSASQCARVRRCLEESAAWHQGETAFVNESFARQMNLRTGDTFLLRVRKPTSLSGDLVVNPSDDDLITLRLKVGRILPASALGDFDLVGRAAPPLNVFLPLDFLGKTVGQPERANLLVQGEVIERIPPGKLKQTLVARLPRLIANWFPKLHSIADNRPGTVEPERALAYLRNELTMAFKPEDAQIDVRGIEQPQTLTGGEYIQPCVEITSPRVFLDAAIERASLVTASGRYSPFITNGASVLTYLANLISTGSNGTPYSMITAAGPPWTPADLRDDEMLISDWLANDLGLRAGDTLSVSYYLPDSGARLTEATNLFIVRDIVPMRGIYADRTLMPQFPGLEKAETTAEWNTAFPLVHKIRPQDDDYWTEWRGAPKAYVTLAAGQRMWSSRFGNLTAIRFPVPTNSFTKSVRKEVYENLRANLNPHDLGLDWQPVREQALKAAEQSQDFGGLFIGFSLFVIVAALLLMAMLFQFSLEQRTAEIGTLLALGFAPKQVRRLFLREGAALAFIGGIIGTVGGIGYAKAMLHGLTTIWSDAVGASSLKFFVTAQTLAVGLCASTLVAVFTLWLALRKQAKQPARELLAGNLECEDVSAKQGSGATGRTAKRLRQVAALQGSFALALGLIAWALVKGDTANAGIFFGAGALVLIGGLAFVNGRLSEGAPSIARLGETVTAPGRAMLGAPITLYPLALRGLSRRRSRSVATVAMLASGTFLIVSIGVFRLDANRDATQRSSGTGGFALIGESTMPVVADLSTKAGRETFALNEADFKDVNFVQFRVRAGDEASCLNLNRAQKPRLLGVKPTELNGRFTAAKGDAWPALISTRLQPGVRTAHESGNRLSGFNSLDETDTGLKPGANEIEIPAIGDAISIQWAMGKKVGDTLDYVDERGQPFKVRIVGAVANSILQGQLIIDEAEFVKRFPSESGYKYFLIDAPTNRVADVSAKLSRALQDAGLELTPAPQRLAQFNAVQNTYLGTFQILGGLGLLLGSAGLGIVVLRNVLERRGELAVLLAVGWLRQQVRRLVLAEHVALLGFGLAIGIAAAFVAVLPSLLTPGADLPWLSLGATLFGVCANGLFWAWLATRVALRGNLLGALRGE